MANRTLTIVFPRKIPDLLVSIEDSSVERTCEDVKLQCVEYLKESGVCECSSQLLGLHPNNEQSLELQSQSDEDLIEILPAFGLMKTDRSVWLPPNYVFKKDNKHQAFKFRIRHRPCTSKVYQENKLFCEFFVLQVLEDLLQGALGKDIDVPIDELLQMTTLALYFPTSLPLDNSYEFNKTHNVKKFNFSSYHKLFPHIFKRIMDTNNVIDSLMDRYHYYKRFKNIFKTWTKVGNRFTIKECKERFVTFLLEKYPWYCLEKCSVKMLLTSGVRKSCKFMLSLYNEPKAGKPGIYFDGIRHCGLEDIGQLDLIWTNSCGPDEWQVTIDIKFAPMHLNKTLLFQTEEEAVSFITMLQGYMSLCVNPYVTLCQRLKGESVKVRDRLKSFCHLSHEKALQCLVTENDQKQERYKCGFIIYQSKQTLLHFHVASTQSVPPVCEIRVLDGKGYLLYSPPLSDQVDDANPQEFENVDKLRKYLITTYGSQLNPQNMVQAVDPTSMFFMEKAAFNVDELADALVERNNATSGATTSPIMEDDLKPEKYRLKVLEGGRFGEDEHLNRLLVVVRETEQKLVLVELVPNKRTYMEAMYEGMATIAKLGRLNPMTALDFYGQLMNIRPSFLFENTEFGDLLEFLKGSKMTSLHKMELARQVVKIFCVLTQPRENTSMLFHGNLRGYNFYVFKKNGTFLKLGDPGLVHFYNTLPLEADNNDKRIPWLSPERRRDLANVTIESECYAVATTLAEIFHGTDNFKPVLGLKKDDKLSKYFVEETKTIPKAVFSQHEDEAVTKEVLDLVDKLWVTLTLCWDPDPHQRPSPTELQAVVDELVADAKAVPQETILEQFQSELNEHFQIPIREISTTQHCHEIMENQVTLYIPPTKFTFERSNILGKGAFGVVCKGLLKEGGREIANKILFSDKKDEVKMMKDFLRESHLSASLSHPNIVKCLHTSFIHWEGRRPCIIMEYMNKKTLKNFVLTRAKLMDSESLQKVLFTKTLLKLAMDVAKGMSYLEKEKVVHCDLACRNVLLHDNGSEIIAKVSDFGLAKVMLQNKDYYYTTNNPEQLPISWYAPEYLVYERHGNDSEGITFTSAGDVWAYGTTLWETFHKGSSPVAFFDKFGIRPKEECQCLYHFYMEEKGRWPQAAYMDRAIYDVMLECWREDETRRPTFMDVQKMFEPLIQRYTAEEKRLRSPN